MTSVTGKNERIRDGCIGQTGFKIKNLKLVGHNNQILARKRLLHDMVTGVWRLP